MHKLTFILFAFFSLVFRILAVPTPVPNGINELAQRDSNTPDCDNPPNNTTSPPPSTSGPPDGGNSPNNTTSPPPDGNSPNNTTSPPPDGGNSPNNATSPPPDGNSPNNTTNPPPDGGNSPNNTTNPPPSTSGPPDGGGNSGNPPNTSGPSSKIKSGLPDGGDNNGNPPNTSGPSPKTKSSPPDGGDSSKSHTKDAGNSFTGRGTYYSPSVGLGACGKANSDKDAVVAIPPDIYDSAVGVGPHCGQKVNIRYKGTSTKATVADKCPSCGDYGIDMSPTVFQALAQPSVGVIKVTWNFV